MICTERFWHVQAPAVALVKTEAHRHNTPTHMNRQMQPLCSLQHHEMAVLRMHMLLSKNAAVVAAMAEQVVQAPPLLLRRKAVTPLQAAR